MSELTPPGRHRMTPSPNAEKDGGAIRENRVGLSRAYRRGGCAATAIDDVGLVLRRAAVLRAEALPAVADLHHDRDRGRVHRQRVAELRAASDDLEAAAPDAHRLDRAREQRGVAVLVAARCAGADDRPARA